MGRWALMMIVVVAGCGDGSDDPDAPVATLGAVLAPLSGNAEIVFGIADADSRLVNVSFLWGTGPDPRTPITAGAGGDGALGLSTSPQGTPHTFIWSTPDDVGFARNDDVYLSILVDAGSRSGVGDEIGPFTVDNTALPERYRVDGDICRASTMIGTMPAGGDNSGRLYIGLYDDLRYPPLSQSLLAQDLQLRDLSDTATCVSYDLGLVAPGSYQLVAILDDDNDNLTTTGFLVDEGDLTNLGGDTVDVSTAVSRRITLDYYCTPPQCP